MKLLLLGYEIQVKKFWVYKKFSCYIKVALNVAVHKKNPRKEYITPDYRLSGFFLDQLDGSIDSG